MIRVWFNHWFSTSYRLIELMKQDKEEEIYVIGSNQVKNSIIQNVCDEWYEEPGLDGEEYIEHCLDFCKEHKVDVFVPRRKMVDISESIEKFTAIGVKVMVDAFDKIEFLNDKAATYNLFKDCEGLNIPEFYIARNADEFMKAYDTLKESYDEICFKFVKDEGGMSFRRIVDAADKFRSLSIYPGSKIVYGELIEILKSQQEFKDIIIMPYLPGNEISVDCLTTDSGLIAVTRIKGPSRDEQVVYDESIIKMCEIILEKVPLNYPCNIQFKIKDDIPYLLEINTRMSGGLQMSCLAAEVNIPNIALNKMLGKNVEWSVNKQERRVSYIEIPALI